MQHMNGDGTSGLCHCTGSEGFIDSPGVDTVPSGICVCFKYILSIYLYILYKYIIYFKYILREGVVTPVRQHVVAELEVIL